MVRGRRDPGRATPVRSPACSARARKGADRARPLRRVLGGVSGQRVGSGMRFRLGCTLVLLPQQPLCAVQTTHNALLDARALRLWHAEEASATACDELCPAAL